mmetsp:Transcript_28033/g.61209  ORF Transcript_28033/g.61209 Transcript_28033/m.61209 type:complete len:285 (+) Transcript_28033:1541-2395(+)
MVLCLSSSETLLLRLGEQPSDELLSLFRCARPWQLHGFRVHVFLTLERKTTSHQAEHDDAHSPAVHLEAVAQLVKLRGPVDFGTAGVVQSLSRWQVADRAEIAQEDAALRICNILAIHQVVVALDVAVDYILAVKPGDAFQHLLSNPLDSRDDDLAFVLPVTLHPGDHVASLVQVKDHVHEDLFVVDVVQLNYAGVCQLFQHLFFPPDVREGRLDLVDHLYSEFLLAVFPLAGVDYAKGPLAKHLAQGVLVQKVLSLRAAAMMAATGRAARCGNSFGAAATHES